MGIYIKGMEMPNGNNAISIVIFSNGKVSLAHDKKYAEYAEAVPLPEGHGRLIDADKLDAVLRNEAKPFGYKVYECGITDGLALARECVKTAPTILDDLLEFEAEALGYRKLGKAEDGET